MAEIVPDPTEIIWFMIEEDRPPWPIYELSVNDGVSVVGECYGFEYNFVSKPLDWIICENHHDYAITSGNITHRLVKYAA